MLFNKKDKILYEPFTLETEFQYVGQVLVPFGVANLKDGTHVVLSIYEYSERFPIDNKQIFSMFYLVSLLFFSAVLSVLSARVDFFFMIWFS